ncbi:MAG TPA: hypothetical protein VMJ32_02415, partial [Pirellulales bacterium]|nr:hypothetical protein [Pirellulales bacterium]
MAVVTQLEALQQLLFVYRTALVPDAIKQPYDNWIDDADAARRNLLATGYVLPDAWLNLAKQSPLPKWWASRFPVTHSRYPDPEQVQAVCTEIEAEIKRLEFSPLPVS